MLLEAVCYVCGRSQKENFTVDGVDTVEHSSVHTPTRKDPDYHLWPRGYIV